MKTRASSTPRTATRATALLALALAACNGSGTSSSDTVTVNGDVPLAYVKRATSVGMNPTDGANSAPGGDLMLREKSSARCRPAGLRWSRCCW